MLTSCGSSIANLSKSKLPPPDGGWQPSWGWESLPLSPSNDLCLEDIISVANSLSSLFLLSMYYDLLSPSLGGCCLSFWIFEASPLAWKSGESTAVRYSSTVYRLFSWCLPVANNALAFSPSLMKDCMYLSYSLLCTPCGIFIPVSLTSACSPSLRFWRTSWTLSLPDSGFASAPLYWRTFGFFIFWHSPPRERRVYYIFIILSLTLICYKYTHLRYYKERKQ